MRFLTEYKFIVDPNVQHNSIDSFERSLATALRGMGYEPELVDNGESKCKIVILKPIDMPESDKPTSPPGKIINSMSKSRDFSGKFTKNG